MICLTKKNIWVIQSCYIATRTNVPFFVTWKNSPHLIELVLFFTGSGGSGEITELTPFSGTDCDDDDDDDEDCSNKGSGDKKGIYVNLFGLGAQ